MTEAGVMADVEGVIEGVVFSTLVEPLCLPGSPHCDVKETHLPASTHSLSTHTSVKPGLDSTGFP